MTSPIAFPAAGPVQAPPSSALRTFLTLILFVAALGVGVAIHLAIATPPAPLDRFPTIVGGAPEPQVTATITRDIAANDPRGLAATYSADMLQAFQEAMAPVVEVDEIRYSGGVERAGEILAGYVVTGHDQQGQAVISGFVIHVTDAKITGFN